MSGKQCRPLSYIQLVLQLIDYNRSSVTFPSCDWWFERFFYSRPIGKFHFKKHIFLTFYFYRQVKKKWHSKLSICVIIDLWSIKMKKNDKIDLKKVNWIALTFFLFLNENICCGNSLEAPQRDTSNENAQHMFSWRNKKKFTWIPLLLIWSYE